MARRLLLRVRRRDALEAIAFGIVEVDTTPAMQMVDLPWPRLERVSPVLDPAFADPREDRVELCVGDEKGDVVVATGVHPHLGVVEGGLVSEIDHLEDAAHARRRQPQDLGGEPRGTCSVAGGEDGVVEADGQRDRPGGVDPILNGSAA